METKHYKMVLLGDSGVGKSSIVTRAIHDEFRGPQGSTIGAAFFTHSMSLPTGYVNFEIWDTAGQERYRSLAPMYYRNSHIALIVFDLTSRASFESAKCWIHNCYDNVQMIVLIGNKTDKLADNKCEFQTEATQYASKYGYAYHEVSAKRGTNVQSMFQSIATQVWNTVPRRDLSMQPVHQCNTINNQQRCCK